MPIKLGIYTGPQDLAKERLDHMEEAVQVMKSLFDDPRDAF